MSSKRYPEEFKIEAVKQGTKRGHPVAEAGSAFRNTAYMSGLNAIAFPRSSATNCKVRRRKSDA